MTGDFLPPIGMPPSIELIPPSRLRIDPSYQRSIENQASQTAIARFARQWDWRLCVPLLVSRRDDGLYIIDGQHRREAAMRRGDIPYLPCCVSDYGSPADEAAVFITANSTPKKVHRVDQFRAALLAGDPVMLAIDRVVRGAGLELVATSPNGLRPGQINATSTIATAIKRHGEDLSLRSLTVIAQGFSRYVIPNLGMFMLAVAELIKIDRVDAHELMRKLQSATPFIWIERAKSHALFGAGGVGAALALRHVIKEKIAFASLQSADRTAAAHGAQSNRPAPSTESAPALKTRGGEVIPPNFEERLAAIKAGKARAVPAFKPKRPTPEGTLGGVVGDFD